MKMKKMRSISSKVKTEKRVSVNFTAMEFAEFHDIETNSFSP